MPRLSASASWKALPRQIPTSSTVWWRSTSVSPRASTFRSRSPCLPIASSLWFRNGMVVWADDSPLPSTLSWSRISVSRVFRSVRATRPIAGGTPLPPPELPAAPGPLPPPPRRRRRRAMSVVLPRLHAPASRLAMRLEPLGLRQPRQVRPGGLESRWRVVDQARALDEVLHREPGGEPRRGAGGQDVVRPRQVVADDLGGVRAQEDRAGVADGREPPERVGDRQLQVLGREAVGDLHRLRQVPGHDHRPVVADGGPGDLGAREAR